MRNQLLSILLNAYDTFASLQQRVAVVEAARKTSPLGRHSATDERSNLYLPIREPEIKGVSELSDDAFRSANGDACELGTFCSTCAQVVKLQRAVLSVEADRTVEIGIL